MLWKFFWFFFLVFLPLSFEHFVLDHKTISSNPSSRLEKSQGCHHPNKQEMQRILTIQSLHHGEAAANPINHPQPTEAQNRIEKVIDNLS
ncbi:hypothetical protein B9Z19DRAFT_1094100 [Tuber borchii]|uniref:Uncharacterized protein n=1 Tax=Tuber borchii TaxID=42251 RepID=A0A2T6ZER8_TUBBO|nr:hypothetical protein B9Z19DRAFT_1094100 [Tuber borchii]